jgi:hypothetical protein
VRQYWVCIGMVRQARRSGSSCGTAYQGSSHRGRLGSSGIGWEICAWFGSVWQARHVVPRLVSERFRMVWLGRRG